MTTSSRTSRQIEIVQKFADNKGRGTLLAATGFGKTYTAIMVILRLLKARPNAKVLVVVPTIIIFNGGKEVKRYQADISFSIKATKSQVQGKIDDVLMESF